MSFGVNFIARFSGIEHIEVCVRRKGAFGCRVLLGWIRGTSGYRGLRACRQSHLVSSRQRG